MRTRAGWLALVLTTGAALAPSTGRAQPGGDLDVGRPNPNLPVPLYHDRPESGGVYTAFQFLLFQQRVALGRQPIAIRGLADIDGSVTADLNATPGFIPGTGPVLIPGVPIPGRFIGSGALALHTDQLYQQRNYEPGWGLSVGYRLSDGTDIEARWWHIATSKYSAGADVLPKPTGGPILPQNFPVGANLADTFLFSPVFNFPVEYAGQNRNLNIGLPGATYGIWNAAQSMQIDFRQRYDQWDLSWRTPVYMDEVSRTHVLLGGRAAWIWEKFSWRTVDADPTGASGPDTQAIYSNVVSNRMYGVFVGCEHEWWLGKAIALGVRVDAAALGDGVHEIASYERGDRAIGTGGSKRVRREFNFVPELVGNANVTWYPFDGMQVRVGWNGLAFFNTIFMNQPVDFNFASLDPDWKSKAVRFLDGLEVGFSLIF